MYICCVYTYIYTRSFLYLLSRRRTSGEILSQAGQSVPEWLEKALMGSQRVLWYGAYPRNPQNSETARKNKGSGGCLGEICWMTKPMPVFFWGLVHEPWNKDPGLKNPDSIGMFTRVLITADLATRQPRKWVFIWAVLIVTSFSCSLLNDEQNAHQPAILKCYICYLLPQC